MCNSTSDPHILTRFSEWNYSKYLKSYLLRFLYEKKTTKKKGPRQTVFYVDFETGEPPFPTILFLWTHHRIYSRRGPEFLYRERQ